MNPNLPLIPEGFHFGPVAVIVREASPAPNWPVVDVSDNLSELVGYDRADLISGEVAYMDMVDEADRTRVTATIELAVEAGADTVEHEDYRLVRPDGSIAWVSDTTRLIRDDDNNVIGLVTYLTDITDRKAAEADLKRREERFQHAIEGSRTGVWDWDAGTNRAYFSPTWKEMLGYAPDEVGDGIEEWDGRIHPEDRDAVYEDLNRHLSGEAPFYENVHRLRCKDGSYKFILDRGRVIERGEDGGPLRVVGTHTDMTAYKAIEERLAEAELRYRTLFDESPDGLTIIDTETALPVEFNELAHQQLGYSREEFFGMRISDYEARETLEETARHIEQVVSNGRDDFETVHKRKDGSLIDVYVTVKTIILSGRTMFYVTFRDISEQVRQRQALRESEERFRQLAENIDDVFWLRDDRRMLYVSPAYETIWGRSRRSLYDNPSSFIETVHPDDREAVRNAFMNTPSDFDMEYRIIRPDGEVRWVWARSYDVADAGHEGRRRAGIARDISDRKAAEEALRAYSQRLALASRSGGIGVWEWNFRSNSLVWDERMRRLYGVESHRLTGTVEDWRQRLHPEDLPRVESSLQSSTWSATPWDEEFRIVRPDGAVRTVRAAALTQHDAEGRPERVIGVNWDVTAQKAAESALERKGELLAVIARAATDLLVNPDFVRVIHQVLPAIGEAVSADRVYLFENGVGESGRGFTSQRFEWTSDSGTPQIDNPNLHEVPLDTLTEFVEAIEDHGHFAAIVRELPAGDLKSMLKNQDIRSILIVPVWVRDQFWGFVGFDDCGHERRWSEDEYLIIQSFAASIGAAVHRSRIEGDLADNERRYRGLVESQQDLVVRVDPAGRFTYVNDAYCRRFGRRREELIGHSFTPLVHDDDIQPTLDAMKALESPPYRAYIEQRAMTEDGWRWLAWEDYAIRDDSGETVEIQGVGRDITPLKETEEKLKSALAEAEAARQRAEAANRAKSDFLATMSHEIRTPMNAILGFTEILREWLSDQPEKQKLVKNVHGSGESLLALINDILDLSKIEAGKMEVNEIPVDLRDPIAEIVDIFSLQVREKGLALTIDIPEDFPGAIRFDAVRLRQILFNLVGNAVKFTPEGEITIRTWYRSAGPDRINLTISVSDTGIGIDSEEAALLFEPFRQVGDKMMPGQGTGLGLAISRRLTELMGGEISLASELGRGSTFTLHFPAVTFDPEPTVRRSASEPHAETLPTPADYAPATILVVDDMADNRVLIKKYLEPYPFRVIEAANGQECLDLARQDSPDLILLDLRMPVMNGHEALVHLKADGDLAGIPVVALTASAMKETRDQMRRKSDGFLSKPLRKQALLKTLADFLPHQTGAPVSNEESDDPGESAEGLLPPSLTDSRRAALRKILAGEIAPLLKRLVTDIDFTRLSDLADLLAGLGDTHNMAAWTRIAGEIRADAEVFDIENLDRRIAEMWEVVRGEQSVEGK